ncbi:MAG: ribonuclease HII [Parcubacteria group bacterium Licking1014_17]|nr:MAG: ribonuclease HII [Parcubacteria group bacterium Licking1014_17]
MDFLRTSAELSRGHGENPVPKNTSAPDSVKLPTKTIEKKLFADGWRFVCGIDEVGMGCLAGPVVVCAVTFTKNFYKKTHKKLCWLRDSKLLSHKQREKFAEELKKEKGIRYELAYCLPKTIDKINIYQAARRAMKRAVKKLKLNPRKTFILVDGPAKIQNLQYEQSAIVKGDRRVFAIACASILAKVHRDKRMINYAKRYPNYGFEKHKGYGTKLHKTALLAFGPTEIHRRSFAPVSKLA